MTHRYLKFLGRYSRSNILLALLALLLTFSMEVSVVEAQAWTKDQGKYFLSLNYRYVNADSFYGPDFETTPVAGYKQHSLNLYGEVGLISRWLTASVDAEIFRRNVLTDQGATTGLGDTRLGLWTGLVTEPFRLSFGVIGGFPTGDSSPSAGSDADEEAQTIAELLPTGDGEFDAEMRLALGYSFGGKSYWPLRHFTQASFGYWARTDGFAQAVTYNFELGTKLPWAVVDRFWIIGRLGGVESFASNEEARAGRIGLGNGVTYTSYGFELLADIWNGFGAGFGAEGAFRGRSVFAAPVFKFSIFHQL